MMKKKQGFTLIELLAVVVILAVIALISVPLIMNVIDGARKGALQNTAYGIAEAGKYTFTNEVIKEGAASFTAYTYEDGVETSSPAGKSLNYKGERPKTGTILINSKGDIALAVYNGKYCAEKGFDDVEVTVSEKTETDCKLVEALTEVEVLVVAGGGGGAQAHSTNTVGGGGAGGIVHSLSYAVEVGKVYNITVGDGGGRGPASNTPGLNGQNSSITGTGVTSIVAIGGGGGMASFDSTPGGTGLAGGSGGGAGTYTGSAPAAHVGGAALQPASASNGFGYRGGDTNGDSSGGGGGGGAGGAGVSNSNLVGGNGGPGLAFDTSGISTYYGGGGGGSGWEANTAGLGGIGGGGNGVTRGTATNANGVVNTGGGGGGSKTVAGDIPGNGGSGIVIIRYYGLQKAQGGAITTVDGYTIHTFTSGTATFEPFNL